MEKPEGDGERRCPLCGGELVIGFPATTGGFRIGVRRFGTVFPRTSSVAAWVCLSCGNITLVATEVEKLRRP